MSSGLRALHGFTLETRSTLQQQHQLVVLGIRRCTSQPSVLPLRHTAPRSHVRRQVGRSCPRNSRSTAALTLPAASVCRCCASLPACACADATVTCAGLVNHSPSHPIYTHSLTLASNSSCRSVQCGQTHLYLLPSAGSNDQQIATPLGLSYRLHSFMLSDCSAFALYLAVYHAGLEATAAPCSCAM